MIFEGTLKFQASQCMHPAIYIYPGHVSTEDPWSEIGINYTFSVHTNYNGSDVCGYEFKLTYNPSVLEGIEVVNGDLLTEDNGTTLERLGTFDNTAGTLSLMHACAE
jgi:hypothetical protein